MTIKPKVSLIFPVYGQSELLLHALTSLKEVTKYPNYEIILVDDCSPEDMDGVYAQRHLYDKLLKLQSNTGNSTVVVNEGVKHSTGEMIQYQNTDVYFEDPLWLNKIVETFDKDTAVVGPALLYPDGTIQSAGMFFDRKGVNHHLLRFRLYKTVEKRTVDVPMVTGCGLTTRRDIYDRLGGFRVFSPHGWDDADWCLRVKRAGYKIKLCLDSSFHHLGTVSYSGHDTARYHQNRKRILREFKPLIRKLARSRSYHRKYMVFLKDFDENEINRKLLNYMEELSLHKDADMMIFSTNSGRMKTDFQGLGARIFPPFFLNTAGMKGKMVRLPRNLHEGLSLLQVEKPDCIIYDVSFRKFFRLIKAASRFHNDAIAFVSLSSVGEADFHPARDSGAQQP